jgi:hypothetical protein
MSDKFTIDDIHRIRYENYENTKDLNHQELIEKTKREAEDSKMRINELRKNAAKASSN